MITKEAKLVLRALTLEQREALANWVADYSWLLPLTGDPKIDELTDQAACDTCTQIAGEILRAK